EERLRPMGVVMLLRELARDVHELQADELEPSLLVAGEDAADELALDAIRLDEDEGPFGHAGSPSGGSCVSGSPRSRGSAGGGGGGGGAATVPPRGGRAAWPKARRASDSRPTRRYASPRTSASGRSVRSW